MKTLLQKTKYGYFLITRLKYVYFLNIKSNPEGTLQTT